MVKIGHVIDNSGNRSDELDATKIEIGCDSIEAILKDFNIVIGRQMCKLNIRITAKIGGPIMSRINIS